MTYTDVERSFFKYKNVLADNQQSFDLKNIKKKHYLCDTIVYQVRKK